MTDEQLQTAKGLLVVAFEARLLAADTYVKALEFCVPLVGGDPRLIKDARNTSAEVASWCDEVIARIQDGSAADLAATFKAYQGT